MDTPIASDASSQSPTKDSSTGAVIGAIIIVLLLVSGGIYFFLTQSTSPADKVMGASDPTADNLGKQSSSDELPAIESDLSATSFTNLDADVENINAQ